MGRFDKKDPKLSEVKAVLQRLQGFSEPTRDPQKPAGPVPAAKRLHGGHHRPGAAIAGAA